MKDIQNKHKFDFDLNRLDLMMLHVGYATVNNNWNFDNVQSPFFRMYFVTKGEAHLIINGKDYLLKPDNMYFIPAFTPHSYRCNSYFEHYYLHVYETIKSGGIFNSINIPFEVKGSKYERQLFERLREINTNMRLSAANPKYYDNQDNLIERLNMNKQRAPHIQIESRGIGYQLISRFLEDATPKYNVDDNRIKNVLDYINKNITRKIELYELLDISSISRDHFIRLFKKYTGQTPNQYLTQRKMEAAQVILTTGTTSTKDVAYNIGYDDPSYFNRLFKKHVGITPQQYRKKFNI